MARNPRASTIRRVRRWPADRPDRHRTLACCSRLGREGPPDFADTQTILIGAPQFATCGRLIGILSALVLKPQRLAILRERMGLCLFFLFGSWTPGDTVSSLVL